MTKETPLEARVDAFYRGRFEAWQPVRSGYRSGLEALLLAAAVPAGAKGTLVDIGAGTGVAGFAAASRSPDLNLVLVEKTWAIAALAAESLRLPGNRHLANRSLVIEADVVAERRRILDLAPHRSGFDWVLTNPPFYPPGERASRDPIREAALRIPHAGFLEEWFEACSKLTGDNGRLVVVVPVEAMTSLIPVLQGGRMGRISITPVHAEVRSPAKRILVTAIRGSKAPLSMLPPIALFDPGGNASHASEAISEGVVDLGWPD